MNNILIEKFEPKKVNLNQKQACNSNNSFIDKFRIEYRRNNVKTTIS
jgi:hypothetical protein